MLTALLVTSLALAPTDAMASVQSQSPVSVWLSRRGEVERGDRVRVYARAELDGYLLILHAEPDGRIRILFPLDPYEDNFVRGARDYEVEGRGGREAFRVYERDGIGTVYAAFSRDPFQFDAFVQNGHWDYRLLETWRIGDDLDPEAELTALAQQMAGGSQFDYDLTSYFVGEYAARSYERRYRHGYYYTGSPYHFGISPRFGSWYPWSWRLWWYSSSWVCGDPWFYDAYRCDPWYWGYDPYWYDPWWYGPYRARYYYRPYYYGYYYGYYPPYRYYAQPGRAAYRDNRLVIGRYTFKPSDRSGLADGGITVRRRFAPANGSTRRVPVASVERRSVTTPALGGGRRLAPTDEVTSARRVRPDGWGITDGRRTVTPRRDPVRPSATERRVAPRDDARRADPGRRVTPTRPETRVTPNRSQSPTRRATPQARPTLERRAAPSTPSRRATPQRRPSPRSSASPRRPSASEQRAAPARRTAPRSPARPTPTRRPTSSARSAPRPATRAPTRSAPRPTARTAPSRSSAPAARPSSPSRSAPTRSTPSRSSGRRRPD